MIDMAVYNCEIRRDVRDRVVDKFSRNGTSVAPFVRKLFEMLDMVDVSDALEFLHRDWEVKKVKRRKK